MGTPGYASPEQLSKDSYSFPADIFSLGIVFAEVLHPLRTQMERALLLDGLRTKRCLPKEFQAALPAASRLLLAITDPVPSARPTAQEVLQVLPLVFEELDHQVCVPAGAASTCEIAEVTTLNAAAPPPPAASCAAAAAVDTEAETEAPPEEFVFEAEAEEAGTGTDENSAGLLDAAKQYSNSDWNDAGDDAGTRCGLLQRPCDLKISSKSLEKL